MEVFRWFHFDIWVKNQHSVLQVPDFMGMTISTETFRQSLVNSFRLKICELKNLSGVSTLKELCQVPVL